MNNRFFYELVAKYLNGTATEDERKVVEDYYDYLSTGDQDYLSYQESDKQKRINYLELTARIQNRKNIVAISGKHWLQIAAAVVIVLLTTSYFIISSKEHKRNLESLSQSGRFKNDVLPGHVGAVLTIGSGQRFLLDSIHNGLISKNNAWQILKKDSSLSYLNQSANKEVEYNTVSTGRGQVYQLVLADGSHIWLDALSSIHFPNTFNGKERIVEITGQVYFEVTRNTQKPFVVRTGNQVIQVLGTHFNVNAYGETIKTTLLEGSVKLTTGLNTKILKPGELASNISGALYVSSSVNIKEATAWKNDRFQFDGASIDEILSQVSRWYDVNVEYKGEISETFVANISRDVPLSRLLKLLEMTKQVAFTIDGRKVTVWNVNQK